MKFKTIILFFAIYVQIYSQSSFLIKVKPRLIDSIKTILSLNDKTTNNYINLTSANNSIQLKSLTPNSMTNELGIFKVVINDKSIEDSVSNFLYKNEIIEYTQLINKLKIDTIPNDSLITQQWALQNLNIFTVWNITDGAPDIIIGIIDTGIEDKHYEFNGQLFMNSGEIGYDDNGLEKSKNNIDDDDNGYVDDFKGWDFTDRTGFPYDPIFGDYLEWDNEPNDENGHGTSVAGIIGAIANNKIGIAGVASGCKILNLRAFDKTGEGEEDDVAAAILYACAMGVKIINMSFGDDSYSQVLKDVIEFASKKGMIFIGSAGNTSSSLPHYPSSYSDVISVGANNQNDVVASFSNFGSTIDLVAPGVDILSTDLDNSYKTISGTSAAAPFVAAATALLLSRNPQFTGENIKQILKTTCDDIDSPGWDLKSGAGRLNILKALQVAAPSIIHINTPNQDYSTYYDSIAISATILSPMFKTFSLYYGVGLNPSDWNLLTTNSMYQVFNENIYTLDIKKFADTCYTLRLIVELNNNRITEERVNFYIDHSPPVGSIINICKSFYGEKSTILASIFTNEKAVVKMFYREKGSQEFDFVFLDGFSTNNQFVKQQHFGFIPKTIVKQNSTYEVYFQIKNEAELISELKNGSSFFEISTDQYFTSKPFTQMNYSLLPGRLFPTSFAMTSSIANEIFVNCSNNSGYFAYQYKLENNEFSKIDSLKNKRPKSIGDFNNNGKIDILSLYSRNGFIDEQTELNSSEFSTIFSDTTGNFWPSLANDIDNDGFTEIISVNKIDSILDIWEANQNLQLSLETQLHNFTSYDNSGFFGSPNVFGQPNVLIDKIGGTDKNRIWTVDGEGDILSYNIDGFDTYSHGSIVKTYFSGENGLITSGDYDGDGYKEIGVLLKSMDEIDIAPFNLLLIFNFLGDSLNIIYSNAFLDPSASFLPQQFTRGGSSIKLADIDNDLTDELIVLMFPYTYILQRIQNQDIIIHYDENTNWELNESYKSIFFADLNQNSVPELALPKDDKIYFYEFSEANIPNTPTNLSGYSIDSTKIVINWTGSSPLYHIYRIDKSNNPILIDSTTASEYSDFVSQNNEWYSYFVKAFDSNFKIPNSMPSKSISIYAHCPGVVEKIIVAGKKNLQISFSEKTRKSVERLDAFKLDENQIPNSIIAASEYSYLLNFSEDFQQGEHQLSINGLIDYFDSPIENDTLKFYISPENELKKFFVSSSEIISPYKIKIDFNLDIDPTTITNTESFTFQPSNKVTAVEIDKESNKTLYLSLENPVGSIGKEYILVISNVYSSDITGGILIEKGAGSSIVLSSFSGNLNDVYVYPNPVNLSINQHITFANLTKKAEIFVFNINGKKIKSLFEEDGNGGIEWDLKDENGNNIGSGIYIYKVNSLDENGNKLDQIIKKFAIVR